MKTFRAILQKLDIGMASVMTIILISCLISQNPGHNWGGDFALYINQAKAIADGSVLEMMQNNKFAIDNSTAKEFSPISAPWGWPLLLVPVYLLFGHSILAFKVYGVFFFVFFLFVFYRLIEDKIDKILALIIIAFLGFNIYYLDHVNVVLTEIPFLFFSVCSLLMIEKWKVTDSFWRILLVTALLFFTFCIRSEGIALFCALAAWQGKELMGYYKSNKKLTSKICLTSILPYLFACCFYFLFSLVLPSGFTSHLTYSFLLGWNKIEQTFKFYQNGFSQLTSPYLNTFSSWLLFLCFFVGFIKSAVRNIHIFSYFIVLFCVFLIWPFQELRYLFSVFPFFVYFVAIGLSSFPSYGARPYLSYVVLIIVIIFNGVGLTERSKQRFLNREMIEGPETESSKAMFSFIKAKTTERDVIVFFRPRVMSLYSKRRSAMVFDNWENIRTVGDFLVLHKDKGTFYQMNPADSYILSAGFIENFLSVYENDQFLIYKIIK